jgi:hypothetical protein
MGRHRNYGASVSEAGPQEREELRSIKVTFSAASMRTLSTIPVPLVPAPGAGFALIPFGLLLKTHNTAAAFAGGSDINVYHGPPANGDFMMVINQIDITYALNMETLVTPGFAGAIGDIPTNLENVPLQMAATGADFTGGDGTVDVTTFYAIVPTP